MIKSLSPVRVGMVVGVGGVCVFAVGLRIGLSRSIKAESKQK